MPSHSGRAVLLAALGTSCIFLLAAPAAYAVLGGSPMALPDGATSVSLPSPVMRTASAAVQAAGAASTPATVLPYTVRVTTLSSGTVVREYISASGEVFGLSWRGPLQPDLASLLGSYFPQFVEGAQAIRAQRGGGHGPASINLNGLVVRSGGHMGAFSGQAWLPQALPAGVSDSAIQ
ncbi:DUF2844 domain-containing protein [Paraburkholderia bonniea]|uniref:DUF2844 domain-containing protein n=1 Tax=Paraburkholderia bonniea TaxID=2152891 RepID=UPI00129251A8|nr:DUF2844 domain-containing protein [Paraburkholderia bonniea]WJF90414.1 DUF2844 domain-containing protein [Paraburkholderia bonniea]WJF93729.1 DUF2844 domain-containing protein [Paraburkholderia bonniea]